MPRRIWVIHQVIACASHHHPVDLLSRIVSSPGKRLWWDLFIKINPQNTGPKNPDRKENVLYDSFYIKCKHRQNQSVLGGVGIFAGAGTGVGMHRVLGVGERVTFCVFVQMMVTWGRSVCENASSQTLRMCALPCIMLHFGFRKV